MPDTHPPVVAVTGYKDSGKTTAVEMIVRLLRTRGYDVATIKHCHHGFDIDRPGKDSWRHREAGATGTAVMGPGGVAVIREASEDDPCAVASWAFPEADLVLAEGFHWLPLPRIEVVDFGGRSRDAHPEAAVIARLPHGFGQDAIVETCDRLIEMVTVPANGAAA